MANAVPMLGYAIGICCFCKKGTLIYQDRGFCDRCGIQRQAIQASQTTGGTRGGQTPSVSNSGNRGGRTPSASNKRRREATPENSPRGKPEDQSRDFSQSRGGPGARSRAGRQGGARSMGNTRGRTEDQSRNFSQSRRGPEGRSRAGYQGRATSRGNTRGRTEDLSRHTSPSTKRARANQRSDDGSMDVGEEDSLYDIRQTSPGRGKGLSSIRDFSPGRRLPREDALWGDREQNSGSQASPEFNCDLTGEFDTRLPSVPWPVEEARRYLELHHRDERCQVERVQEFYARSALFIDNMSDAVFEDWKNDFGGIRDVYGGELAKAADRVMTAENAAHFKNTTQAAIKGVFMKVVFVFKAMRHVMRAIYTQVHDVVKHASLGTGTVIGDDQLPALDTLAVQTQVQILQPVRAASGKMLEAYRTAISKIQENIEPRLRRMSRQLSEAHSTQGSIELVDMLLEAMPGVEDGADLPCLLLR